jgi:hypothetical protein
MYLGRLNAERQLLQSARRIAGEMWVPVTPARVAMIKMIEGRR